MDCDLISAWMSQGERSPDPAPRKGDTSMPNKEHQRTKGLRDVLG